nr:tetratricopeptide repeat protein [Caldimonas sp.]
MPKPRYPSTAVKAVLFGLASQWGAAAMAIDVSALWTFSDPALSEQRFQQALADASPDDAFILRTQIARTWGLRGDFERARATLAPLEAELPKRSAEAKVRYALELGRTYASPAHPPETQTPEQRERARPLYLEAFETAKAAQLDRLAIDALHMMVMVDSDPADQLAWNIKAITYLEQSTQADARKWEGSLRNNIGHAQRLLGNYDEALRQFHLSLAAHERDGGPVNVRIAHWMIARTLRDMKRYDEAIAIQLRLEREWAAAGKDDPYVFEELEQLYRATGDVARADRYAERLRGARQRERQ